MQHKPYRSLNHLGPVLSQLVHACRDVHGSFRLTLAREDVQGNVGAGTADPCAEMVG